MRISQTSTYLSFLRDLQLAEERTLRAQSQVSSGKRVQKPSDDPLAIADILRLTAENAEAAQFRRNLSEASARLELADSVLDQAEGIIERVRNLGFMSLSNVSTASLYKEEVSSLRDQILSMANTAFQGIYIFGGTASGAAPFLKAANGVISYQGNSSPVNFQVNRTMKLQAQIPGNEIFAGASNVFVIVKDLADAMGNNDFSAIEAQVVNLKGVIDTFATVRSRLGSAVNLAQSLNSELDVSELSRASRLEAVESADIARAISELTQSQTGLQATLAVGARLSQLTLLDYLN